MMTIIMNQSIQGCLPKELLSLETEAGILAHQQSWVICC